MYWNAEFKLGTLLSIKLLRAEVGYEVNDTTKRASCEKGKTLKLALYLQKSNVKQGRRNRRKTEKD